MTSWRPPIRRRYPGMASRASSAAPAPRSVSICSNSGTTRCGCGEWDCRYSTASTSEGARAIEITYAPSDAGSIAEAAEKVSSTSRASPSAGTSDGFGADPSARPAVRNAWRSASGQSL